MGKLNNGHDGMVVVWVDVGWFVVPDHLSDVLDGFNHAPEGLGLILGQPTPLPLTSRCLGSGSLVWAIDDDGIGLLRARSSLGGGEAVPRGLLEPMANFACGDTTDKDGVHLMVVVDRLAEELDILGVILKKDNKKEC
jgi:hypothetical protein